MPLAGSKIQVDILVAGSGAAGLSAALALARAGFSVLCVGRIDLRENGRTVALFEASLRFYKSLGLWDRLRGKSAPLEKIRMIDVTGAQFPAPEVFFAASEIGLGAFGANIENNLLVESLVQSAGELANLGLREGILTDIRFEAGKVSASTADGETIEAKLIVAADGRSSLARTKAAIGTRAWTYPQIAFTALLAHQKPHRNVSTEFHTRAGPCTLVPLRPAPGKPNRSSLVWLMTQDEAERRRGFDDAGLAAEIERQVAGLLGAMEIDGARGFFPMTGMRAHKFASHRIALVGETAHVFPPLAAQGLNLSLRDSAALAEILEDAHALDEDIGASATLSAYDRMRRGDIFWRTNGIDLLNRSLLADILPVDLLRGAGFLAFSMIGPLRRAIMREGVLTHQDLPRLMQPLPRPLRRRAAI
jgi:2-octaprenyl-6-methoxyphenol hydroxylase